MRIWILAALLATGCVSQSKYVKVKEENDRLHARIDRMEKRADAQLAQLRELIADLKPLIDRKVLEVEVVEGRVTIGMASDVLFASGSAELSAAGKESIGELTRLLKRRAADHDFQVEGHTDNEDIHTEKFPNNWHLGAARSIAVVEYMIAQGFPEDHVSAATFSDTKPVEPNSSASGRALNRRIEVVVLPDLSDLPGYEKLTKERPARARSRKHKKS
ncbi:MAG: OmpA/MotB family protein [Myxococcota bacterium]